MPIAYKIDVLSALKEKGFSTYRMRKEKILAESTIQAFRSGDMISYEKLAQICKMLDCQPGDVLEYVPDAGEEE